MGVISVASSASAWRGYEYYKSKKVKSYKQISDYEYTGQVKCSNDVYNVFIDTKHVRKSTCDLLVKELYVNILWHYILKFFLRKLLII